MGYGPEGHKESDTLKQFSKHAHTCACVCVYMYIYTYDFLSDSTGQEFACNVGYSGSIPGPGRGPEEGIDYPFRYS